MKRLSESIFNAGIKRNQGDGVRKEDNVDLLGRDDFYVYLNKHYRVVNHMDAWGVKSEWGNVQVLGMPLFCSSDQSRVFNLNAKYHNDKIIDILLEADPSECDFMNVINKKYYLTSPGYKGIVVKDKQGKISNSLYLDFIETVLVNTKYPLLEKRYDKEI